MRQPGRQSPREHPRLPAAHRKIERASAPTPRRRMRARHNLRYFQSARKMLQSRSRERARQSFFKSARMPVKILLTHTPDFRRQYYGERSLKGLQALAEVKLHERDEALDATSLVEAAGDVDIIVADRVTEGRGEIFPQLPKLRAFVRCAVDIRNVDVAAASAAGVLVTRASPGFVPAVAELALGFMVDLSRGVSRTTADYHAGRKPEVAMGRQLAGSRIGIIGYGSIGRHLAILAKALGMAVLVADPYATISDADIRHVALDDLLGRADYVVCLAIANEQTENLIGQAALSRMLPHAFFINLSRGNLVDEPALAAALRERRIAGAAMDV